MAGDSSLVEAQPGQAVAPFLFENTRYEVICEAESAELSIDIAGAALVHSREAGDRVMWHHAINFGNQVGFSEIAITSAEGVLAKVTVEVFPLKVDYRGDYRLLRDEVGEISRGLAISAMAKTFDLGSPMPAPHPTMAEWAALLESCHEDLTATVRAILAAPHSAVVREIRNAPVARARRVDNARLEALLRRRPTRVGAVLSGVQIPVEVPERRHRVTRDTPENRYLKASLAVLALRLREVIQEAALADEETATARQRFCRHIRDLAAAALRGVSSVTQDPMWGEVAQVPPVPPRSQVLLTHPLYSRAAKLVRILAGGVSLDGEALRTPIKDIATLYEHWCFLKVVDLLERRLVLERETVISARQLEVELTIARGMESAARFRDPSTGRAFRVAYNPTFSRLPTVPQRPDIWLEADDGETLILDPKYRLAYDREHIGSYGAPGPPSDAINAMHRYRDAIVSHQPPHRRRASTAVALFPFADEESYANSRLFKSIEAVGVGGLPFLPGATGMVEALLDRWLAAAPGA